MAKPDTAAAEGDRPNSLRRSILPLAAPHPQPVWPRAGLHVDGHDSRAASAPCCYRVHADLEHARRLAAHGLRCEVRQFEGEARYFEIAIRQAGQ